MKEAFSGEEGMQRGQVFTPARQLVGERPKNPTSGELLVLDEEFLESCFSYTTGRERKRLLLNHSQEIEQRVHRKAEADGLLKSPEFHGLQVVYDRTQREFITSQSLQPFTLLLCVHNFWGGANEASK